MLIHHFSKLGGSIHDPSEKLVDLLRFDDLALIRLLKSDIMEKHLTFPLPTHISLKDKNTVSSFTTTMEDTHTLIEVRQIVALPPFIANAIIISWETSAALIGIIVTSDIEDKRALVGEDDDYSDID